MVRTWSLAAVALAGLLALPACGGEAPRPAEAAKSRVSERPAGMLVYVSNGNRLTAIDVATGRRRARGCRRWRPAAELHVLAGRIVFAGLRGNRTIVFSIPVALDRPPTRLGPAHLFVPSATAGRVWLAGVDCDRPAMSGVREVTVDGRVTVDSRRRVPGTWVSAAVRGGLVIQRGRRLSIWDPRTGRTVRRLRLAVVSETRGDLMVGCTARCHDLAIADAATAHTIVARAPRGRLDLGGALSAGGSLLAAPALRDRRWSVALVNTRSGVTSTVPGSRSGRAYSAARLGALERLALHPRPAAGASSHTDPARRVSCACRCGCRVTSGVFAAV